LLFSKNKIKIIRTEEEKHLEETMYTTNLFGLTDKGEIYITKEKDEQRYDFTYLQFQYY